MDLERLQKQLSLEEGVRNLAYKDSKGIWTIGIGHNIETRPISDLAVKVIFEQDVDTVVSLLDKYLPWWKELDDVRQNALVDLGFNLGVGPSSEDPTGKLLLFTGTLEVLKNKDYEECAKHLEGTLWYKQVGSRALRVVKMIRTGEWS